jgi:hypothetical protein
VAVDDADVALEGRCFGLAYNQFTRTRDFPRGHSEHARARAKFDFEVAGRYARPDVPADRRRAPKLPVSPTH